jgi:hypothetical protein
VAAVQSLAVSRPRVCDERLARRALLAQVGRLEEELIALSPITRRPAGEATRGGPRLLGLGELEAVRDGLVHRLAERRHVARERAEVEEQRRRLLEEMILDPARHRWMRVRNEELGEPGCTTWRVRPRWGLLGMLMGWWRVVVSSGCP